MTKYVLGFIGGSGLYDIDFLKNKKKLKINSSWGKSSDNIIEGKIDNQLVYFLSRHGKGHKLSPTAINYRANIVDFYDMYKMLDRDDGKPVELGTGRFSKVVKCLFENLQFQKMVWSGAKQAMFVLS